MRKPLLKDNYTYWYQGNPRPRKRPCDCQYLTLEMVWEESRLEPVDWMYSPRRWPTRVKEKKVK